MWGAEEMNGQIRRFIPEHGSSEVMFTFGWLNNPDPDLGIMFCRAPGLKDIIHKICDNVTLIPG